MEILLLSPTYLPSVGGQERQVVQMSSTLTKFGHQVSIYTETDFSKLPKNFRDEPNVHRRNVSNKSVFSRVVALFKCLHFLIMHRRDFDLIVCRTFCTQSLAVAIAKQLRILDNRIITYLFTDSHIEMSIFNSRFREKLVTLFDRFNIINATNHFINDELIELGFSKYKLTRLPCMLSFQKNSINHRVKMPNTAKKFVYLGNINFEKGVFELIEAFQQVRAKNTDISLNLAGFGSGVQELKRIIEDEASASKIRFDGRVEFDEVQTYLKDFDCLIFPSHSEGFGLVPFEAATLNCHVISTRVADIEEILGERAHFFDVGDVEGLTQIMNEVIKGKFANALYNNQIWLEKLDPILVTRKILREVELLTDK